MYADALINQQTTIKPGPKKAENGSSWQIHMFSTAGLWWRKDNPAMLAHVEFVECFTPVKIPFFQFTWKNVNRIIFGKKLIAEDVLLTYLDYFASFCAIIFSDTNSIQLFCGNLISQQGNFLALFLEKFTWSICDKFQVCMLACLGMWLAVFLVRKTPV